MKLFNKSKYQSDPRTSPQAQGSPRTFSYYASRRPVAEKKTGRHDNKTRNEHSLIKRLPGYLAVMVIAGSLLYILWLDTRPKLSPVVRVGAASTLQDNKVYEQAATEILKSSPFNRLKLTINTPKIAALIKERFPELAEVAITMPLIGQRLVLELEPVKPSLAVASAGRGVYVIDEQGRAAVNSLHVPDFSKLNLPLVRDESGLELNTGMNVLTRTQTSFILAVRNQLSAAKIGVSNMTLPGAVNELRIRPAKSNYYMKLDMSGNPRLQIGRYIAAIGNLRSKKVVPKEYIDVRVEDKVFYK